MGTSLFLPPESFEHYTQYENMHVNLDGAWEFHKMKVTIVTQEQVFEKEFSFVDVWGGPGYFSASDANFDSVASDDDPEVDSFELEICMRFGGSQMFLYCFRWQENISEMISLRELLANWHY